MNKQLKTILTGIIPAIVFGIFAFLFKAVYIDWSPMILICIYCVLLSVSFAASFCLAFNFKKSKLCGFILFAIGAMLFNGLLWGIAGPIQDDGRFAAYAMAILFLAFFILEAVFTAIYFIRKKSGRVSTVVGIITAAALLACGISDCGTIANEDYYSGYKKAVLSVAAYENTFETAYPQTTVYDMVEKHFSSPLPEGKKTKKCIVMGYDGARADTLSVLSKENSVIKSLLDDGGHAYLSYAGGALYPGKITQATSTAPGWCSILTGKWGTTTGIILNDGSKSMDHPTSLTSLAESGKISSSAFYTIWSGHFTDENSTYLLEKEYVEKNKINTKFVLANDNDDTFAKVKKDVESEKCTDYIFYILEHCDQTGHGSGFSLKNENYVNGFKDSDRMSNEILNSIKSRKTYDEEDWLIIVTADHGGFRLNHGGDTIQERFTFIVSNGKIN